MARILVIDDDADLVRVVRRVLESQGHSVVEASDGHTGFEELARSPVDLVITDINMPGMDGIEVILELHTTSQGVPVIAMTGGGRMPPWELLGDAEALGAVSTLAKPFELEELIGAVEAALAGPSEKQSS